MRIAPTNGGYSAGCKHSAEQEKRDNGQYVPIHRGLYFRIALIDLPRPRRTGGICEISVLTLWSLTHSSSDSPLGSQKGL